MVQDFAKKMHHTWRRTGWLDMSRLRIHKTGLATRDYSLQIQASGKHEATKQTSMSRSMSKGCFKDVATSSWNGKYMNVESRANFHLEHASHNLRLRFLDFF